MGRQTNKEAEYRDSVETFKAEAIKNAINAFNEGYLMGKRHAEEVFGGDDED